MITHYKTPGRQQVFSEIFIDKDFSNLLGPSAKILSSNYRLNDFCSGISVFKQ